MEILLYINGDVVWVKKSYIYQFVNDIKHTNPKIEVDADNFITILDYIPEFLPHITDESHLGTIAGIKLFKRG